jgi:RimJ/RimL family protein N-acetyltransferase
MIHRRRLPARWSEHWTLADGRHLLLRPIDPRDAEPLRAAFTLLTPEERRMRFLSPINEMSTAMAERLTRLDPRREFALVVAEPEPPGEALIGAVVRAALDADAPRAEFALLVIHLLSRQGIGSLLLRTLLRWARLKRLQAVYGDVLIENTAMLALCDGLGFRRRPAPEPGQVRVEWRPERRSSALHSAP